MTNASPPLQQKAVDDVHILDRLAVLYRYRFIVMSVFVLTTLAIMIQGYTTLQLYQAQGRVLIEAERSTAVPGLAELQYYEDPQAYLNTQFKIIKSFNGVAGEPFSEKFLGKATASAN